MRRLLTVLLVSLIATPALAGDRCDGFIPKRYDYPFQGKYVVKELSADMLALVCEYRPVAGFKHYGCANPDVERGLIKNPKVNEIYILKGLPKKGCLSRQDVIDHEMAHLNGWNH